MAEDAVDCVFPPMERYQCDDTAHGIEVLDDD
jgi:hypothetical protein